MSLPRFQARIFDALGPTLTDVHATDIAAHLAAATVTLEASELLENHETHTQGFLLLANLAARLYPRIRIVAPPGVASRCTSLIQGINPDCELELRGGATTAGVVWGPRRSNDAHIAVLPEQWHITLDDRNGEKLPETNALTAFTAAALAAGELFRTVFNAFLPASKRSREAYRLSLFEFTDPTSVLPTNIPLGRVHLAGAGAVGQAMVHTLAALPVAGDLVVFDPESISLSNLQRYVLTNDDDVGTSKTELVARALTNSNLKCIGVDDRWGVRSENDRIDIVCTALDSEQARIGVQASLPRAIYNAWTQPSDLGWSRHESFGSDPCLACLYWPRGQRLSQHVQIARALRESELRVLAYLTHGVSVDSTLRPEQVPQLATIPAPSNVLDWSERPLLDDLATKMGVSVRELSAWKGKRIADLYRDGICGGAIVGARVGEMPVEVAVPLAHQSVLAGVMLAVQLIAARVPEMRLARGAEQEGRLDMMAVPPRIARLPRQRTPGCICSDGDFVARYTEKWS